MRNFSVFFIAAAKRREKGISLHQISTTTKISVRSLQAIEDGDFTKLPGGIYNTSYIKQYARAVDVDEAELLAVYEESKRMPVTQARSSSGSVKPFLPALQG